MNWIGIPSYNCKDLTLQTVNDCLQQDIPVGILVVDNGSTDGLSQALEDLKDPRIHILRSETNDGVGPAWNHICRMVFSGILSDGTPADHVLIINNDIRLRPDTYRNLLIPIGGFVTAVNVGSMERMLSESISISPNPIMKGGPDFSCFLIKRWFYQRSGEFPECYWPGYMEDRDYQMLAISKGLGDMMYGVPVPYFHMGSQTIKNNPLLKRINDYMFPQNKALFVLRWGGEPHRETFVTPQDTHFVPKRPPFANGS